VTIGERIETARRERRVLTRVSRAGWRLEQAERERRWALVSARAEGISIRALVTAIGLSPSRVRQLVAAADLDALDELRAAGWPAPEDPDSGEDIELGGRDTIAGRLSDEVSWLRQCAGWLARLDADSCPPAASLRPSADWPARAIVAAGLARVAAVIDRIAADVDELARARRAQDLATAAVLPDPRAERRRRLAEPDLEFRAFCTRRRLPASQPRNWSGPGTRGRPSGTSAAKLTNDLATPATRSGHANDHPRATRAVQETGRLSGADGARRYQHPFFTDPRTAHPPASLAAPRPSAGFPAVGPHGPGPGELAGPAPAVPECPPEARERARRLVVA